MGGKLLFYVRKAHIFLSSMRKVFIYGAFSDMQGNLSIQPQSKYLTSELDITLT